MSARWRFACAAGLGCALAFGCAPAFPVVASWKLGGGSPDVDESERALWNEGDADLAELEKAELLVADEPLDALFADVVKRIAPTLDGRAPPLRVRMVASAERNASASANGSILVPVGLLAELGNEAELAALLGHEISHVVRRHHLMSLRYAERTDSTVDRQELARIQEWEADDDAIERMAAAGYDQAAMAVLLSRLDTGAPDPMRVAAWESHPDLWRRIASARWQGWKAGRATAPERYESALSGILLRAAELEIEAGEFERARAAIARHRARIPNDARAYFLEAEVGRRTLPEGHRASAVRSAYERAVQLDPDYPEALRALGLLLRETGERDRARDLLERYLRAAPDAVDRSIIERYLRSPSAGRIP